MMSRTRMRGLSEANGSWNTIWMSRRRSRSAAGGKVARSSPANRMRPALGAIRLRIRRPIVDLPHQADLAGEEEALLDHEMLGEALDREQGGHAALPTR